MNFAISRSSPNGPWQRLERGEIKLDAEFFKAFNANLQDEKLWKEYHTTFRSGKQKLKDVANPTQLGDHVSLKAEATDSSPTDNDKGAQSQSHSSASSQDSKPSLSKLAKDTTIGDPVSLEAEEVVESSSSSKPSTASSSSSASSSPSKTTPTNSNANTIPPLPTIDGEKLFWNMMRISREPDPYVYPALRSLKSSHTSKFILGALSNTVAFPANHEYSQPNSFRSELASQFDVFISSSDVGLRKPDPKIYQLALQKLDEFDKQKGGSGVKAQDVVFLDDIGENLRVAKEAGMRTIRVQLGKSWRAVKVLEKETGVELMDEKTRRSKL